VIARVPAINATGVAVDNNITATFSEAVNGVTTTTFAVRPTSAPTSAPIAGTVTRNGTTNQWILNPTANLAGGTSYTVTLTGGPAAIRDLAGAPLATTSWSFTTAGAVVNAPPTVTARTPAINATGVTVGSNITATFSEAVNGVTTTTFAVRPTAAPASAPIAGTVTRNGTTNQWILNPTANLAANTSYTVRLTGGTAAIRDLAGAALATTSWSFTTGTVPGAPPTPTAVAGVAGGVISATVNWTAPTNTGGSPITGYIVRWQRVSATGTVLASGTVSVGAAARTASPTLPVANVNYRFAVRAVNANGQGAFSANSNTVIGR
jgi:phosphoribosylformimino-5-aminoimidazole carboxamide ribonucleotide (ProFAR) isomerase